MWASGSAWNTAVSVTGVVLESEIGRRSLKPGTKGVAGEQPSEASVRDRGWGSLALWQRLEHRGVGHRRRLGAKFSFSGPKRLSDPASPGITA